MAMKHYPSAKSGGGDDDVHQLTRHWI